MITRAVGNETKQVNSPECRRPPGNQESSHSGGSEFHRATLQKTNKKNPTSSDTKNERTTEGTLSCASPTTKEKCFQSPKLTFQGADEHVSCIQNSRASTVAALRLHTQLVQYGRHQLSLGVRQLVAVSQIGCVTTAQVLQLRKKIRDRT